MINDCYSFASYAFEDFENIFIATTIDYKYSNKLFWVNKVEDCFWDDSEDDYWVDNRSEWRTYVVDLVENLKCPENHILFGEDKNFKYLPIEFSGCEDEIEDVNSRFEKYEKNGGFYSMYFSYKKQIYCCFVHRIVFGDLGLFLDFRPDEIIKASSEDEGVKSYLNEINRRGRIKKLKYYLEDV